MKEHSLDYITYHLAVKDLNKWEHEKVNHDMKVLKAEDDNPIPGLFACGTDTANVVFGGEYCFYNPGSTMSWALNSGRMAAMEAWDYIEGDDFVE